VLKFKYYDVEGGFRGRGRLASVWWRELGKKLTWEVEVIVTNGGGACLEFSSKSNSNKRQFFKLLSLAVAGSNRRVIFYFFLNVQYSHKSGSKLQNGWKWTLFIE
jgi:hypothetical protein